MNQSAALKLNNTSLKYGLAYFFNQLSFTGLRYMMILYMISKSINMEQEKAITIYEFSVTALIFFKIIGAIIGDLITGSKKATFIGGITQAAGTFILFIPGTEAMYIGLGFVFIGNGFFSPNLMAAYAKNAATYNSKALNAAILLIYLIAITSTVGGAILISGLSDYLSFQIIFVICGIIMLLSSLIIYRTPEQATTNDYNFSDSVTKRILYIAIGVFITFLFSIIYSISKVQIHYTNAVVTYQSFNAINYTNKYLHFIDPILAIPLIIFFIILWSLSYRTTYFRLMSTFVLTALVVISFLYINPDTISNKNLSVSITLLGTFNAIEMLIFALSTSLLIENINHKYLASSINIFSLLMSYISTYILSFSGKIHEYPTHILIISLFGLSLFTGIFLWWSKKLN